jgi:hypothetical protein
LSIDEVLVELKMQNKGESPKENTWAWVDVMELDVKQFIWDSEEQQSGKSKEEIKRTLAALALQ